MKVEQLALVVSAEELSIASHLLIGSSSDGHTVVLLLNISLIANILYFLLMRSNCLFSLQIVFYDLLLV